MKINKNAKYEFRNYQDVCHLLDDADKGLWKINPMFYEELLREKRVMEENMNKNSYKK